ncbi:MAG TPA: hypothetical protein VIY28_03840 [Pseudonocardiaceae bacterium]
MGRNGKPSLLLSPNSILANALLRSIDLLRPRVLATRPSRIEFVVGTQINGAPHLGTNLVQTSAFLLAKIARREFSIDTRVRFGALDNAPHDVVLDPETHTAYQQTYFHALGKDAIAELIEGYYRAFFDSLSVATDTDYEVESYTDQQAAPGFRAEFCVRWNGSRTSAGGWPLPTGSSTSASPALTAAGLRSAPTAPSSSTSTRMAPPSPRSVSTTAPTRRTSIPRTARPTWIWPRSTATWSRTARSAATPTPCTS